MSHRRKTDHKKSKQTSHDGKINNIELMNGTMDASQGINSEVGAMIAELKSNRS
jgi:hypothetical protein